MPSIGPLVTYIEPTAVSQQHTRSRRRSVRGECEQQITRIDTGVREGDTISMYYDPMISKLCTWASTRDAAISTMQTALDEYTILNGVTNNISFLQSIFRNSNFRQGKYSTKFIPQEYPTGFHGVVLSESEWLDMTAAACWIHYQRMILLARMTRMNKRRNTAATTTLSSPYRYHHPHPTRLHCVDELEGLYEEEDCHEEMVFYALTPSPTHTPATAAAAGESTPRSTQSAGEAIKTCKVRVHPVYKRDMHSYEYTPVDIRLEMQLMTTEPATATPIAASSSSAAAEHSHTADTHTRCISITPYGDTSIWSPESPLTTIQFIHHSDNRIVIQYLGRESNIYNFHSHSSGHTSTAAAGEVYHLSHHGYSAPFELRSELEHSLAKNILQPEKKDTSNVILCPMPGNLISLAVKVGDKVEKSQTLCTIEAMKMQVSVE